MKQFTNDLHLWPQHFGKISYLWPKIIIYNETYIILYSFHMRIYEKKHMETIDRLIGNKTLPFHLTLPCIDFSCLEVKVTVGPQPQLGRIGG